MSVCHTPSKRIGTSSLSFLSTWSPSPGCPQSATDIISTQQMQTRHVKAMHDHFLSPPAPGASKQWFGEGLRLEKEGTKEEALLREGRKRCLVFSNKPSAKNLGHSVLLTVAEPKPWTEWLQPVSPQVICGGQLLIRAQMWLSGLLTTNQSHKGEHSKWFYYFRMFTDPTLAVETFAREQIIFFVNLLSKYSTVVTQTHDRVHSLKTHYFSGCNTAGQCSLTFCLIPLPGLGSVDPGWHRADFSPKGKQALTW
jgi:hypothetical protein